MEGGRRLTTVVERGTCLYTHAQDTVKEEEEEEEEAKLVTKRAHIAHALTTYVVSHQSIGIELKSSHTSSILYRANHSLYTAARPSQFQRIESPGT